MLIRPLTRLDAESFFQLRLRALQEHPEAFGSSYEEESVTYLSLGFLPFGEEKNGLFLGNRYVDELYMVLPLS